VSGRVKWKRVSRFAGLPDMPDARVMCIDGDMVGSIDRQADGQWFAWLSRTGAERTFRRRSAAKRWLLARAAGLAEVPRRASFGTRYGSPQTNAVVPCGPEGMSVPRGWRVVDAYVAVDGQVVVMLERNRRRR